MPEQVAWGQRHSPHWPSAPELRDATALGAPAWVGGPALRAVVADAIPLIRAYFLLGYRTRALLILDYLNAPAGGNVTSGRHRINLETGEVEAPPDLREVFPPGPNGTQPAPNGIQNSGTLQNGAIHVIFDLVELTDVTGYLRKHGASAVASYAVALAPDQRFLSLSGPAPDLAGLRTQIDDLMARVFPLLDPPADWPNDADDDDNPVNDFAAPTLPRVAQGGMLWIFDPSHWGGLSSVEIDAFRHAKNLVNHLVAHQNRLRQFVRDQVFDRKMRHGFFTSDTLFDLASCAQRARDPSMRPRGKASLFNYTYSPDVSGTEDQGELIAIVQKSVHAGSVFRSILRDIEKRGVAHVLHFDRYASLKGKSLSESWLDTLLSFAWTGAIKLADAVWPRPAPDPFEVVPVETGQEVQWVLKVHGKAVLRLRLLYARTDQHPDGPTPELRRKICVDYKFTSQRHQKPTLMVVAGRGIEISLLEGPAEPDTPAGDFKKHFEKYFDLYALSMPWRLEIYRVQSDVLVPAYGSDINPASFLGAVTFNPGPRELVDVPTDQPGEVEKVAKPLIPMVLPYKWRSPGTVDELMITAVRVKPEPYGVRIEFPAAMIESMGHLPDDTDDGKLRAATIPNQGFWEVTVNPFSGNAAFTYDLYLEEFDVPNVTDGHIINLHPVFIVTSDRYHHSNNKEVWIKTSLSRAASSNSEWLWSIVTDNLAMPSEYPGYWPAIRNTVFDASGEYWRIKSTKLHYLPAPLSAKLPIKELRAPVPTDPPDAIYNLLAVATPLNRKGQSPHRFPTTDTSSTWQTATIGSTDLEVKELINSEWDAGSSFTALYLIIDLTISQIPIIGDIVDVAEFAWALMTGLDRWGRPITNFDLSLMALGAAVPMLSSTAIRTFQTATDGRSVIDVHDLPPGFVLHNYDVAGFFRRVAGILAETPPVGPATDDVVGALQDEVNEMFKLTRVDRRYTSTVNHDARVTQMVSDLLGRRALIQSRFGAASPTAQGEGFKFEDILDETGEDMIFSIFQIPFENARAANPNLTAKDFLATSQEDVIRAAARVILGDDFLDTGKRTRSQFVKCPTFQARPPTPRDPHGADDVSLDLITPAQLRTAVINYLQNASVPGKIKLQASGYGRNALGEAERVFYHNGYAVQDGMTFDTNHAFIALLDSLMGGANNNYPNLPKLLLNASGNPKAMPLDEVGARVGESLLLGIDQLHGNAGLSEFVGNPGALDHFAQNGIDVKGPLTDFVRQWVNGAGNIHEHAKKAELVDSVEIRKGIRRMAQEPPGPLRDANFEVESQIMSPSMDGSTYQLGSDETMFYTIRDPDTNIETRYASDLQIKSSGRVQAVAGFTVVSGEAVALGRTYGSALPRLVRKGLVERNGAAFTEWAVEGGSPLMNQIVKQRLRKAHFGEWAPAPGYRPDSLVPPENPDPTLWVKQGWRDVYTIDDARMLNQLIDRVLEAIPDPKLRRRVTIDDLEGKGLEEDELALLEAIFSHMEPLPNGGGVNLHDWENFDAAYHLAKDDLAEEIAGWIRGYEVKLEPKFSEAMADIAGASHQWRPNEVMVRFASDDPDKVFRFLTGTVVAP